MLQTVLPFLTGQYQESRISPVTIILWILAALIVLSIVALKKGWIKSKRGYYPSYIIATVTYQCIYTFIPLLILKIIFTDELETFVYIIIGLALLGLSFLIVFLYFLPYRIAHKRDHRNVRAIYILNIFTAWTVVAWIITLVWAHIESKENLYVYQVAPRNNADEILQYKELYDSGVITQEEFEEKKKQLLDI